jgi:hypothetical protein
MIFKFMCNGQSCWHDRQDTKYEKAAACLTLGGKGGEDQEKGDVSNLCLIFAPYSCHVVICKSVMECGRLGSEFLAEKS